MAKFLLIFCPFLIGLLGLTITGSLCGKVCRLRNAPRVMYGAQNYILINHSFDLLRAETAPSCVAQCLQVPRCLSCYFCPDTWTCVLNDSTKDGDKDVFFVERGGCFYFDEDKETQFIKGVSQLADMSNTQTTPSSTIVVVTTTTPAPQNDTSATYFCTNKPASGVYTIHYEGSTAEGVEVYCDMDTDGGGWIVFQRRGNASLVSFYRNHQSYAAGFGEVYANFWLGNQLLHDITSTGKWQLRVDLMDWKEVVAYAQYEVFSIGPSPGFKLNVGKFSGGTAGDSLIHHNGLDFTTFDYDRDEAEGGSCADLLSGAWWYKACHRSALNGMYLDGQAGGTASGMGLQWTSWKGYKYSLKKSEMKIRPI